MSTLNVRLNDFDAQLLKSLVETTGQSKTSRQSKTSLVIQAIRNLNLELREESGVTLLGPDSFDAFLEKISTPETDLQVIAARERLMSMKPVWAK